MAWDKRCGMGGLCPNILARLPVAWERRCGTGGLCLTLDARDRPGAWDWRCCMGGRTGSGVETLMLGLKLNLAGEIANPCVAFSFARELAGMGELSLPITWSAYESFRVSIKLHSGHFPRKWMCS